MMSWRELRIETCPSCGYKVGSDWLETEFSETPNVQCPNCGKRCER